MFKKNVKKLKKILKKYKNDMLCSYNLLTMKTAFICLIYKLKVASMHALFKLIP